MKQTKRLLKIIIPIVAIICAVIFIPWVMARAWLTPLPGTIQEQVNDALDYNLDGIIVYVDQKGKPPAFYAAGWKTEKIKYQPTRRHYSRLPASASCISLRLLLK